MVKSNSSSSNNKKIAKNTIMLYFRMLLLMLVSLYTIRVVLNTLGVVDYGIYGVVGGVVSMFSFISASMASASQRFLSFDLGQKNFHQLKQTFNLIMIIYLLFAVMIVLLAETVVYWFFRTKLVIPIDRLDAALWIYHFSIFTFVVTILTIPYNAIIIARENMNVYAYVSIVEGILKLLIVYILDYFDYDKLKLYSVLVFLVTCLISVIYIFICRKKYEESRFCFYWDKKRFSTILSYSGWNLLGPFSAVANDQGLNVVINLFYGPIANASMSIATRVKAAILVFSNNFYTAVNPQIIKSYAAGDKGYMNKLIFSSTKFAYFLLLVLSLPLFLEMDFVLKIWLGNTTIDMICFSRLMVLFVLVVSWESPLTQGVRATGNIKYYQISVGILTGLTLPIAYFLLRFGFPAWSAILTSIIIYFLATFIRLFILNMLVEFPVGLYIKEVLGRIVVVSFLAGIIPLYLHWTLDIGWIRLILITLIALISVVFFVYILGLSGTEKSLVYSYIKKIRKK